MAQVLPPGRMLDFMSGGLRDEDEILLAGQRVLVAGRRPVQLRGRVIGHVVTLRDSTEVPSLAGTSRRAPLPRGLSDGTLELVIRALEQSRSGLTAAAAGQAAGISRVTARRYLDHLCRLGLARLTMRDGGPGRPEHRYQLAGAGFLAASR